MDQRLKVMIVEDNKINMKLAKALLEIEGFVVYPCPDAESAQVSLKQLHPDLILMDIALPGIDGLELTKILKADKHTNDIKIIALTAYAMKTDHDRVMEAGCDGYITKPIDTRKFTQQIFQFLK
ncbi:MAG: response regulator [Flavipsychrobacter sp.]|nr:response regulator [Flavipsychrobacter sp.]